MHAHLAQASHPHHPASVLAQYIPRITQATTTGSACTAGIDAIAAAADLIRRGKAEIGMCGATDTPINTLTYAAMSAGGLISMRNDTPEKACRPFDIDRDSGVLSEGSGILILESLEHARSRGVRPYLEIIGYATRVDPDLEQPGSGLEDAMRMALANSGMRTAIVDYISAHGPGHPLIDRIETTMIKRVFGPLAYRIPVTSIKGVIGSPLAAAGPLQVVASSLGMRHGILTPTANLDKPDPACDLDYVPQKARQIDAKVVLINSHGLGGGNSTLIVGHPPP
jgi:3-oxoacyl-[acyl-carrier-protein] synthase II